MVGPSQTICSNLPQTLQNSMCSRSCCQLWYWTEREPLVFSTYNSFALLYCFRPKLLYFGNMSHPTTSTGSVEDKRETWFQRRRKKEFAVDLIQLSKETAEQWGLSLQWRLTLRDEGVVQDREAGLQHMRTRQSERLAMETAEERPGYKEWVLTRVNTWPSKWQRRGYTTAKEESLGCWDPWSQVRADERLYEMPEDRDARLQQMRDRLAAETPKEREARLQQMSARQHEQLAGEMIQESLHHSSWNNQGKMRRFHAQFCSDFTNMFNMFRKLPWTSTLLPVHWVSSTFSR